MVHLDGPKRVDMVYGTQGKHAEAFAARLAAGDLSCKVLGPEDYKKSMLEKLIWIW